jgi:hypothetical protein
MSSTKKTTPLTPMQIAIKNTQNDVVKMATVLLVYHVASIKLFPKVGQPPVELFTQPALIDIGIILGGFAVYHFGVTQLIKPQ